jgi:hypothetical protein
LSNQIRHLVPWEIHGFVLGNILNATTTSVNNFIRKLCMKDPTVEYIDTISDFFNQRAIVKSMFDKNDHSGVYF